MNRCSQLDEILHKHYLDNRSKPRKFQGRRLNVKITGPDCRILYYSEIGRKDCMHDNSWTAALSLMKFCTHLYLDNLKYLIEFQGYMQVIGQGHMRYFGVFLRA